MRVGPNPIWLVSLEVRRGHLATDTGTVGSSCEGSGRSWPTMSQGQKPQKTLTLLTPESWASSFQNCEDTVLLLGPCSLQAVITAAFQDDSSRLGREPGLQEMQGLSKAWNSLVSRLIIFEWDNFMMSLWIWKTKLPTCISCRFYFIVKPHLLLSLGWERILLLESLFMLTYSILPPTIAIILAN